MVFPLAQTFNGPETPGIHIHDVTNAGFLVRMNDVNAGSVTSDGQQSTVAVGRSGSVG